LVKNDRLSEETEIPVFYKILIKPKCRAETSSGRPYKRNEAVEFRFQVPEHDPPRILPRQHQHGEIFQAMAVLTVHFPHEPFDAVPVHSVSEFPGDEKCDLSPVGLVKKKFDVFAVPCASVVEKSIDFIPFSKNF
jgi:hypothetical protein